MMSNDSTNASAALPASAPAAITSVAPVTITSIAPVTVGPQRVAAREALLLALTQIPTAAGKEDRVMAFLDAWFAERSAKVRVQRDDAGNYLVFQARRVEGGTKQVAAEDALNAAPHLAPILVTAHLDHPAFVVRADASGAATEIELEFRGGVNDPYFIGARIELIGPGDARATATINCLDATAKPFKIVRATLDSAAAWITPGCIARWHFPRAELADGCIHTDACDDLAAVAAALAAFDEMLELPGCAHVGLLFTVAEEVGFLGTIHAARNRFIPADARLLCLENSRSFPHDSPIGAGAILRVGDRLSVFTPAITNCLGLLFTQAAKEVPAFKWQRKLMPGGACEATAFASYGYQSTCLCLPLGNYHNMAEIDGVAAGTHPAVVGREFVSLADYHSLIAMLHLAAVGMDGSYGEPTERMLERIYAERASVLRCGAGAGATQSQPGAAASA